MTYPDPRPRWTDNPVYVREFYDAVAEGREAARAGVSVCPYPEGTREYRAWCLGHRQAEGERRDERLV